MCACVFFVNASVIEYYVALINLVCLYVTHELICYHFFIHRSVACAYCVVEL